MAIPVRFVPEGLTVEEARRQAKNRKGLLPEQIRGLVILFCCLFAGAGAVAWYFYSPAKPAETQPALVETIPSPTPLPTPIILSTPTLPPSTLAQRLGISPERIIDARPSAVTSPLATPGPDYPFLIARYALTATQSYTQALGWLKTLDQAGLESLPQAVNLLASYGLTYTLSYSQALALVQTPNYTSLLALLQPLSYTSTLTPALTLTQTVLITPTPSYSTNYVILAQDIFPAEEKLYSYVSGWITEQDGLTPRPVAITLAFNTGAMHYPRPHNSDVASGYYEFLVSPGAYVLKLDDLAVPVLISDISPSRHEISLRYTKADTVTIAARSNPWNNGPATSAQASKEPLKAGPTPPPALALCADDCFIYLPLLQTETQPEPLAVLPPEHPQILKTNYLYIPMVKK